MVANKKSKGWVFSSKTFNMRIVFSNSIRMDRAEALEYLADALKNALRDPDADWRLKAINNEPRT